MLRGEIDAGAAASPDDLLARYEATLVETIEAVSVESVAERSGVAIETVEAVAAGQSPDLTLAEAAAILATDDGRPDPDTIAADARDILLLGMTTAVLDVDTLAAELDSSLDSRELQQKIEGRYPMRLAEFAAVHHYLATATS